MNDDKQPLLWKDNENIDENIEQADDSYYDQVAEQEEQKTLLIKKKSKETKRNIPQSDTINNFKNFGELLMEARHNAELSLDDITQLTNIRYEYIQALEENKFSSLPAKVYVHAYIRQLCREYNTDAKELIEKFDKSNGYSTEKNNFDIPIKEKNINKLTKKQPILSKIIPITLAILAIILIASLFSSRVKIAKKDSLKVNFEEILENDSYTIPYPTLDIPN